MTQSHDHVRSIALRRHTSVPLSDQLFDGIRRRIHDGSLLPGDPLPSTRELAKELGLSRNTVLAAYAELLMHGLVETRSGFGTTVAEAVERGAATLAPASENSSARWPLQPKPPRWLMRAQMGAIRDAGCMSPEAIGEECLDAVVQSLVLRGVECARANVVVMGRRRHALYVIARVLAKSTNAVWFEDPGDPLVRATLVAAGLETQPLPVDQLGANIMRAAHSPGEPGAMYVTSSNQFPLGVVMNARRRRMTREWAERRGGWIIDDDAGACLRWPVPAPLYEPRSRVIHVASFATMTGIVADEPMASSIRDLADLVGGAPDLVAQRLVSRLFATGAMQREVRRLRCRARQRDRAISALVKAHLSSFVSQVSGTETGERALLWLHQDHSAGETAAALCADGIECSTLQSQAVQPVRDAVILDLRTVADRDLERHFVRIAAACALGHPLPARAGRGTT